MKMTRATHNYVSYFPQHISGGEHLYLPCEQLRVSEVCGFLIALHILTQFKTHVKVDGLEAPSLQLLDSFLESLHAKELVYHSPHRL